jgi:site-specific DNA recombinase
MPSDQTNNAQRVALYARVSSDLQSAASIDDQLRICAEWAAKQGWVVARSYTDQALSGASLIRPGIQKLLQDAAAGKVDIIVTEALDRLSRDQEDIAHIYKPMRFLGIGIVTLSEGEVNELHIGLKGTMGALYLKDLGDKTRRGLRGPARGRRFRGRHLVWLRHRPQGRP